VKRNFASLAAQEALHVAVFVEERNATIYREFSEMFAEVFATLSRWRSQLPFGRCRMKNGGHGTTLQKRYFERYGTRPCAHDRRGHL